MSQPHDPSRMRDPRAIRALSHPVRLRLLEVVGGLGTATATQCAAAIDESVASCSFHLRQLAKYDFIERAPSSTRERPWRLTSAYQGIDSADLDAEGVRASHAFDRAMLEWEMDRIRGRVDQSEESGWVGAQQQAGSTTWMTREELDRLNSDLRDVLVRHVGRIDGTQARPPGSRLVRVFTASTLLPELPSHE